MVPEGIIGTKYENDDVQAAITAQRSEFNNVR
jgi:hypothetical protein